MKPFYIAGHFMRLFKHNKPAGLKSRLINILLEMNNPLRKRYFDIVFS